MPRVHTARTYLTGRTEYDVAELRAFFGGPDPLEDDSLLMSASPKADDVIRPVPVRQQGPTLAYDHIPRRGFALAWQRVDQDGNPRPLLISVGNRDLLHGFQETATSSHVSLGTLVPGGTAFRVLEDFAADPERLSTAVDWIESGELDWPDGSID